jgi:5'-nucleotidase
MIIGANENNFFVKELLSRHSTLLRYSDRISVMPLILVTNDDGVHSPGLISLFDAIKDLGDTYVIAPDRERSAVSHALTMHRPLKVEELRDHVYQINGTPTDCVAVGVNKILPGRPAFVVSGINKGANLGDDITYSGTVSAAMESTILGIPAFAVSLAATKKVRPPEFKMSAKVAVHVGKYILDHALPYDTLLNVNVPNVDGTYIKGIKLTRQGKRIYDGSIQETFDPHGEKHYWIGGGNPYWERGEDTDIQAVQDNYISITPIHLDLTNYDALKFLKERLLFKIHEKL